MRAAVMTIAMLLPIAASGQTIQQVEREIRRQGLPHPHIVLAQARLETGNFRSRLCRDHRNLFGIKHNGRYARYARWQDSIKDYKRRISSRYQGGDYYHFLQRIGYAEDGRYITKLKQF